MHNMQKGTLVLLKEDHLLPLQRVIERVVDVYPGAEEFE